MTDQTKNQGGISIYRFEPDNCKRIEQLRYNNLWISNPNSFNDPSDLQLMIKDQIFTTYKEDDFKKIIKFIYDKKRIDKFYILNQELEKSLKDWYLLKDSFTCLESLCKSFSELILDFGVQCFSKSYQIPLNWSHYANGYKGYCIEYNFSKLGLLENQVMAFYDVSYTNILPQVCISEILLTPRQAMQKLLATKTLEWAYEQELRLIHFEKQAVSIEMPKGLSIKRLIAGQKITDEHLELLIESAQILGVPVYRLKRNILNQNQPEWFEEKLFDPLPPP